MDKLSQKQKEQLISIAQERKRVSLLVSETKGEYISILNSHSGTDSEVKSLTIK